MNTYVYVSNNPLNAVDPEGLKDRPYPANGRVINKSSSKIEAVDIDSRYMICVAGNSGTPRTSVDVDFVKVQGTWYKIGVRTFVIDENGMPDPDFDEASPGDLVDINNVTRGGRAARRPSPVAIAEGSTPCRRDRGAGDLFLLV